MRDCIMTCVEGMLTWKRSRRQATTLRLDAPERLVGLERPVGVTEVVEAQIFGPHARRAAAPGLDTPLPWSASRARSPGYGLVAASQGWPGPARPSRSAGYRGRTASGTGSSRRARYQFRRRARVALARPARCLRFETPLVRCPARCCPVAARLDSPFRSPPSMRGDG